MISKSTGRVVIVALTGALLAACASDEIVGGPHQVAPPPPGSTFSPSVALAAGQEGAVILSCAMAEERHVKDCQIEREFPKNWGFGEAALRMYPGLVIAQDEAVPVGDGVKVPVVFCQRGAGPCSWNNVRARLEAHRRLLGPMFPGESPIGE